MIEVLANSMVVIILQYINVSNKCVYLKLIQCMSIISQQKANYAIKQYQIILFRQTIHQSNKHCICVVTYTYQLVMTFTFNALQKLKFILINVRLKIFIFTLQVILSVNTFLILNNYLNSDFFDLGNCFFSKLLSNFFN